MGRMSQTEFNRWFTTFYSLFFMGIFTYSLITGWVIPWESLIGFVVPTVNHIVHQVNLTKLESQNIASNLSQELARNGKSHD